MIEPLLEFDIKIFYLINHTRLSLGDKILPFFSQGETLYGFFVIVSLLLAIWAFYLKHVRAFLVLFFILMLGYPVTDFTCGKVLKPLVNRERPFAELPKVYYYTKGGFHFLENPKEEKGTLGFPSCHASNSGYGAFLLSLAYPKGTPFFLLFTLLVGYSRIYLGHHYPLDVLCGYFLGLLWALLGIKIYKITCKKIYGKGV